MKDMNAGSRHVCVYEEKNDMETERTGQHHTCMCVCTFVCSERLNESRRAHKGHHKQTMKNESGEVVQLVFLWEQLQAGVRTFGDNRFVRVCVCVYAGCK